MRWFLLGLSMVLSSCSGLAVLYTDEVFRASSPEVVKAWESLTPFHNARVEVLPPGTGLKHLEALIDKTPGLGAALVGVSLTPAERRALEADWPRIRFVFVVPGKGDPQEALITVRRSDAWATVARAAATPSPAVALFPSDATSTEIDEFRQARTQAQGGALTTETGGTAPLDEGVLGQVFQWSTSDSDGRILGLPPSVPVHGNPGLVRSPGASGLTWKIRESTLGPFLWQAVWSEEKKSHFLPLETVLDRR